jgi:hypothetical protein
MLGKVQAKYVKRSVPSFCVATISDLMSLSVALVISCGFNCKQSVIKRLKMWRPAGYCTFRSDNLQRKTERQRDRETERQRDRETERQRDRETERQRNRETEKQRDRETERQRDRKTERHKDRKTDRQKDIKTERHR